MNFLFPAMLIGLAGLAVPVILHLIARHKYPVQDFPTISLLRYERRDNAFARRLVDPWQLLLRLLVLALLVLAMSRLFSPTLSDDFAPRNLIVVLDTSASMGMESDDSEGEETSTTPLAVSKHIARTLLKDISLPSRCALVTAGDKIEIVSPLGPDPEPAIESLETVEPGDGGGPGLLRAVARCCEMVRGRREVRSQIVILTDRRASAFESRNRRDSGVISGMQESMGDKLDIILMDLSTGQAENLAIVDSYLRGRKVRMGDDAHVVTTLKNHGEEARKTKLSMAVAGNPEPATKEIELAPGEEVVIDLTARVNRIIRSFAGLMIDGRDAAAHDDVYSVPFIVSPSRRILVVNGATDDEISMTGEQDRMAAMGAGGAVTTIEEEIIDGAKILQYVLNPGRELGLAFGTGLDTIQVTPEAMPAQTLSKYDLVILYDVEKLAEETLQDLDNFVREGRALLIFCSATVNPMEFNSSIASPGKDRPPLSPAKIGNDVPREPAVGVVVAGDSPGERFEGVTYSPSLWLAPYHDRRRGDLSIVRFNKLRETIEVEQGANAMLQSTAGDVLAVEAARGQGRVVLLTFGTELSRGNLAMTKVFPLLTWRLVDYATGRLSPKPPDMLVASTPAALDVSEAAFSFVNELELARARSETPTKAGADEKGEGDDSGQAKEDPDEPIALTVGDQKTVLVEGLPVGHYWLRKPSLAGRARGMGYARPIVVNPDPGESSMKNISEDELRGVLGDSMRLVPPEQTAGLAPRGMEVWRWVVIALVAIYFIEALSAYIVGAIRDKRLEAEEAAEADEMEPAESGA